jgi:hypothetical protein
MAQIYPLKLNKPDDVILADVLLNKHTASLILDTGATNTIIDLNTLLIAGYPFISKGKKKFETANGIIEADLVILNSLVIWDKVFTDMNLCTLDFIEAGITSPFEGVIGLDIMKPFIIKIDFPQNQLHIE